MSPETFIIFHRIEVSIHICCTSLTIPIIIFLFSQFRNAKSAYNSAYFIILGCHYVYSILYAACWIYGQLVRYNPEYPFMPFVNAIQLHYQSLPGFVDTILAINRCTGLAFPWLYKKVCFWSFESAFY